MKLQLWTSVLAVAVFVVLIVISACKVSGDSDRSLDTEQNNHDLS